MLDRSSSKQESIEFYTLKPCVTTKTNQSFPKSSSPFEENNTIAHPPSICTVKRKEHIVSSLRKELLLLSNKAKYILEILDGTIELRNKKKVDIIEMLVSKEYNKIDDDDEYKYLLKMSMDSVSKENVDKLLKDKGNKEKELDRVINQTIENMWLEELIELESHLGSSS